MQLKMRRIGVAVDPPSAARSPLRETTGRDGPYSSFRPIDGGVCFVNKI